MAVYLASMAGRLDRLHHRIETRTPASTRSCSVAWPRRRISPASGLLDPASSLVLSSSAQEALTADPEDEAARSLAESELTRTLGAVLADDDDVDEVRDAAGPDLAVADELLDELGGGLPAGRARAALPQRRRAQHGAAAAQAAGAVVPAGGSHALPVTTDFDDTTPAGLARR